MIWYPHVFKNFPQFVVIHAVKDLSIVSEAELEFFFKFHSKMKGIPFSMVQWMLVV